MRIKKHIYCRHESIYEIPFFDVDSMDIMWHGHYVKYLEMARCAFLEEIHYTYDVMKASGFGYPIVQLNLKYVRPALFRQKVKIKTMLVEYESCLRFEYVVEDLTSGQKLTQGSTTQMAVEMASRETQFVVPDSLRKAVESHPSFKPIE